MNGSFTLPSSGYIVAETRIEPSAISASGTENAPVLLVLINLHLRCAIPGDTCLDFREIRGRLSPCDKGHIASILPTPVNVLVRSGQELPNQSFYLHLELGRADVSLIEKYRVGQDMKLHFDLELHVDELERVARSKEAHLPPLWALRGHHVMRSGHEVVISRSRWVEQVLPQLGYGKTHIVELPAIALSNDPEFAKSIDALVQAQRLEGQGHYDDCVARCRVALEPFFAEPPGPNAAKRRLPMLNPVWEAKVGKATYDWLTQTMLTLKRECNAPHHATDKTFTRMEAQMLLLVTTAVIAYAIETAPKQT